MYAELSPLGDVPPGLQVPSRPLVALHHGAPKAPGVLATLSGFVLAVSRAMGVVVVTAHGHLGASEGDVIEAVLVDLIEGQGNLKVVLDLRDVPGIDRSSLAVLVAATGAADLLGGELTFADPSEEGITALEGVGLGDAITLTRRCGLGAQGRAASVQRNRRVRRAAMAEHPAGTGASGEQPRSLVSSHEEGNDPPM